MFHVEQLFYGSEVNVFHVERNPKKKSNEMLGTFHVKQDKMVARKEALPKALEEDWEKFEIWLIQVNPEWKEEWLAQLWEYATLLYRWSGQVNLVARGDREILPTKHFIPALAMLSVIETIPHKKILDFGSGAGNPGIPLKIALPESEFILLESRRKRANFLREVVRRLGLRKIKVENQRIENWDPPEEGVELVVSRAVTAPERLMQKVGPYLASGGNVLTTLPAGKGVGGDLLQVKKEIKWNEGKVRLGLMAGKGKA